MTQPDDDSRPAVDDIYARVCPVCSATHACSHHLVTQDATFPGEYLEGVFEWDDLVPVFEGLYALLHAEIAKGVAKDIDGLHTHIQRLRGLAPRLREPLLEIVLSAGWEDAQLDPSREIAWDPYVVNRTLADYMPAVFIAGGKGEYAGSTRHEDCVPMASSAYRSYWARDAEACGAAAQALVRQDVQYLKAFGKGA